MHTQLVTANFKTNSLEEIWHSSLYQKYSKQQTCMNVVTNFVQKSVPNKFLAHKSTKKIQNLRIELNSISGIRNWTEIQTNLT